MKNGLIFILIMFSMFLQASEAEFMSELSDKKMATFSDGVLCFNYMYGNQVDVTADFDTNLTTLKQQIKWLPRKYGADKPLTIGDFSLLAIQFLKINGGLFYMMSHSGRYASRGLSVVGIIDHNTSEWKVLSGIDLIRLLQKVGEHAEPEKND